MSVNKSINVLGCRVNKITINELIDQIEHSLCHAQKLTIFTPNTEIVFKSTKDENLKSIVNSADINIPDGSGIVLASKILGNHISKRLAGIDAGEQILKLASKEGFSVFLLGGIQNIAKKAKVNLENRISGLNVCGVHHGYFDVNGRENDAVISKINKVKPDIIFVCMGFPRQEKWIIENIDKLHSVKIAVGLGGSLDVWSEKINRAPKFIQKINLEWLWRIIIEPRRLSFVLVIPIFLLKVLKQKISCTCNFNGKNAHLKHFFDKK